MKKLAILFISLIAVSNSAMKSDDFCDLFQDEYQPIGLEIFYGNNSETNILLNDQSFSQSLNPLPIQKSETIHSSDSQPHSILDNDASSKDTASPLQRALINKILEKLKSSDCPVCKRKFRSSKKSKKFHLLRHHLALYTCKQCNKEIQERDITAAKITNTNPCITKLNGISISNKYHTLVINEWTKDYVRKVAHDFHIKDNIVNEIILLSNKPIKINTPFSKEQNKRINEIKKKAFDSKGNCIICKNKTEYVEKSRRNHLLQQHIHPFACKNCKKTLKAITEKKARTLKNCKNKLSNSGNHDIILNPNRKKRVDKFYKKFSILKKSGKQ